MRLSLLLEVSSRQDLLSDLEGPQTWEVPRLGGVLGQEGRYPDSKFMFQFSFHLLCFILYYVYLKDHRIKMINLCNPFILIYLSF